MRSWILNAVVLSLAGLALTGCAYDGGYYGDLGYDYGYPGSGWYGHGSYLSIEPSGSYWRHGYSWPGWHGGGYHGGHGFGGHWTLR